MSVLKIAAFSDGDTGGNPAGVSAIFPWNRKSHSVVMQRLRWVRPLPSGMVMACSR